MATVVHLRRTSKGQRAGAVLWMLALGCGDADGDAMTQAWTPDASSGAPGSEGESETPSSASDPGDGEDDTPAECDAPCDAPPTDCQLAPGVCDDGTCSYDDALAGTPCITGCVGGGYCDAGGQCICSEACADTCVGAAHMTAACDEAGTCVRTCEAPYEDCDGDPANGCEIPVGMPHQCDAAGINVDGGGCWTAYCGAATGEGVFDFGTYHCVDCATCGVPSAGQCHWCNHDTGSWFPQEACSCDSFENLSCGPA